MVASAQRLCPQAMKAKMYFEKARLRSPCQKGGSWSRGNDGAENCYIWEIWGGFCYQICAGAAVGAAEPSWGFSTTVLFLQTLSRWLPKEDVTVEESDWVCSMPERILTIVQVVRCKAELHHQEQRRHRGPALKVLHMVRKKICRIWDRRKGSRSLQIWNFYCLLVWSSLGYGKRYGDLPKVIPGFQSCHLLLRADTLINTMMLGLRAGMTAFLLGVAKAIMREKQRLAEEKKATAPGIAMYCIPHLRVHSLYLVVFSFVVCSCVVDTFIERNFQAASSGSGGGGK